MAVNVDLTAGIWRTRMTYSVDALGGDLLRRLVDLGDRLIGLPLLRFRFEQVDATAVYLYRIWLTDGRLWRQELTFASGNDPDPLLTFEVVPGWKLSEFVPHRELRDFMVQLRNQLGASVVRIDAA